MEDAASQESLAAQQQQQKKRQQRKRTLQRKRRRQRRKQEQKKHQQREEEAVNEEEAEKEEEEENEEEGKHNKKQKKKRQKKREEEAVEKEEWQDKQNKRGKRKMRQAEAEVEQRAEDEPKPKRSKSKKGIVWAYVLEEQGTDPPAFKLRLNLNEYQASENVAGLARSVEKKLYKSGYFVPERIRVYRNNPFTEEQVDDDDDDKVYGLRAGLKKLHNNDVISDADRDNSQRFYVLVSKLRERQPLKDVTTQATERAQLAEALTNELMKQAVRPGGFLKVDVLAVAQLLGIKEPPGDEIFYRPAYRELFELINTEYDSRMPMEKQFFISVTGTPGIGKSTMLLIFLLEYLRKEKTVAFFRDEELGIPAIRLLFRWDKDSNSVSVEVAELFDSNIVTLTDSRGPGTALVGLVIWAHSPGAEEGTAAAKQFSKETSSVFALPLWTDDEVAAVHARWNVPESADDLAYNQSLWGNVPRQIFRSKEEAEWRMQTLLENLKTCPEESIQTHLSLAHRAGSGKGVRDHLMLMNVPTDLHVPRHNYRPGIRFCTPYVYGQLLDMLNENVDVAQRKLMELFSAVPEAGGALGNLFEAYAHRYLGCTARKYKLTAAPNELMGRVYHDIGTIIEPRRLRVAPLDRVFFHNIDALRTELKRAQGEASENAQNIGLLQERVYYQPHKRNQAAVDSFILIGSILYMFQFTVSPSHDVHTGGLNEVFSLVPEEQDLVYVFVFCVPQHVYDSFRMGLLKNSTNERALKKVQGRARRVLYYKTALPFDIGARAARH